MDWPSQDWKSDTAWKHLCYLLLLSFQGFVPTSTPGLQLFVSSIIKLPFSPLHSVRVLFIFMAQRYSIIIFCCFNWTCLCQFQAGTLYCTASFLDYKKIHFQCHLLRMANFLLSDVDVPKKNVLMFLGFNKCICKIYRGPYYQVGQGHKSLTAQLISSAETVMISIFLKENYFFFLLLIVQNK